MAEYKVLEPCFVNSRLYTEGETLVIDEYDKTPSFLELVPEPEKQATKKKEKEPVLTAAKE